MKIYIGADHRGFDYKNEIIEILERLSQGTKMQVMDLGTYEKEPPCDYPYVAYQVATHVADDKGSLGILLCMTGLGQSIAANKVAGAYATLCYNAEAAQFARAHNQANVLVIGAKYVTRAELPKIVGNFINTKFEGGRHLRRVKQIKKIEQAAGCCGH